MTDHPDGEAAIRGKRGGGEELRFAPARRAGRPRGERWHVEGDLDLLGLQVRDGELSTRRRTRTRSARVWSALRCRTAGEVLASAEPGYEFLDWGGAHHVGGGSHGSLHANDSLRLAALVRHRARRADAREQWSLRDIVPMVARALRHGVLSGCGAPARSRRPPRRVRRRIDDRVQPRVLVGRRRSASACACA